MNKVQSVYQRGVIATIEQFGYEEEELRQFVVYTYYDKSEKPIYIGCSKDFYNTHYLNMNSMSYADEVAYIGFVFTADEREMKGVKGFYIKARNPKYNKKKYETMPLIKEIVEEDDLVVSRSEMEQRWREF